MPDVLNWTSYGSMRLLLATIGLGALVASILVMFHDGTVKLECYAGLEGPAPQSNDQVIRCSDPYIYISCSKGSYVRIGERLRCRTTDQIEHEVVTFTRANNEKCQKRHGDFAFATTREKCGCVEHFIMVDDRCVSLAEHNGNKERVQRELADQRCKTQFGDEAMSTSDGKRCICREGYKMIEEKGECFPSLEACRIRYGETASLNGNEECVCPVPGRSVYDLCDWLAGRENSNRK